MTALDWTLVVLMCIGSLWIGLWFTSRASQGTEEYFISGRNLPWWVLGLSCVATYTDAGLAPAVTMWTFEGGLLGNAVWWIPYVIWMPLAAVFWSKFWRRLQTVTTAELLEVRYSGKMASTYRGIYAFFMSFGYVVVLMGYVSGWLTAALGPVLGWSSLRLILVLGIITLIYTMLSGLYGVAYTDAFQFVVFVAGNCVFIPILIRKVGGIGEVYQGIERMRGGQMQEFFGLHLPNSQLSELTLLAFCVQGFFFAASPSGGEGFTAQRFMAAKNEFHAQVGQLFNTVLTLIVRVVPFLLTGMVAAAVYPRGFVKEPGEIWSHLVKDYAPAGVVGLLVATIFAAYMSTISTEMNWGASYLVNDLYRRFLNPTASDHHYVLVSRASSVLIFCLSLVVAYFFVQGMQAWFLFINSVIFAFILPLSWLRFFWWRTNIWGEAAALIVGLPLGYLIWFVADFASRPFWQGFLLLFGSGFAAVVIVSLLTPAEPLETLRDFYSKCRPPGLWGPVTRSADSQERARVHRETIRDLADCVLGILLCASLLLSILGVLALRWFVVLVSIAVAIFSGWTFCRRWQKRVFGELYGSKSRKS